MNSGILSVDIWKLDVIQGVCIENVSSTQKSEMFVRTLEKKRNEGRRPNGYSTCAPIWKSNTERRYSVVVFKVFFSSRYSFSRGDSALTSSTP
jgi:hypothetical protein